MTGGRRPSGQDGAPAVRDGRAPVEWDAAAYARLSTPQQAWADDVLARLRLAGDETVLDLGCGAGIVTAQLAERVPRGRVIAVDASTAMIAEASSRLGGRVTGVVADLRDFVWPDPVDVVFSTATLHWVPEHAGLWRRLRAMLRPGGTLVAQYGGRGNIPGVEDAMAELAGRAPFREHLWPFTSPWTFESADTAEAQAVAAGFGEVRAWTERRQARPPDMPAFLANAIAVPALDRLPQPLRAPYTDSLHAALGRPQVLSYVRLNVDAVA
jgi:trans-aconitate 2-methyltransferase